jgi:protease I
VKDFRAADLAGVFAPGGWAPDKIRRDETVLSLVRDVHQAGGLIATICHGPWVLISAGIVKGRRLTSTVGIRDDVRNAGAIWEDKAVVEDGNILSSRVPKDLPEFGEALVEWLAQRPAGAAV